MLLVEMKGEGEGLGFLGDSDPHLCVLKREWQRRRDHGLCKSGLGILRYAHLKRLDQQSEPHNTPSAELACPPTVH